MRIDSVAHRLLRELIADCLGHTFETHVRSFINKGHVTSALVSPGKIAVVRVD